MNMSYASFYSFYFYFARNCEAGKMRINFKRKYKREYSPLHSGESGAFLLIQKRKMKRVAIQGVHGFVP